MIVYIHLSCHCSRALHNGIHNWVAAESLHSEGKSEESLSRDWMCRQTEKACQDESGIDNREYAICKYTHADVFIDATSC